MKAIGPQRATERKSAPYPLQRTDGAVFGALVDGGALTDQQQGSLLDEQLRRESPRVERERVVGIGQRCVGGEAFVDRQPASFSASTRRQGDRDRQVSIWISSAGASDYRSTRWLVGRTGDRQERPGLEVPVDHRLTGHSSRQTGDDRGERQRAERHRAPQLFIKPFQPMGPTKLE